MKVDSTRYEFWRREPSGWTNVTPERLPAGQSVTEVAQRLHEESGKVIDIERVTVIREYFDTIGG